MTPLSQQLADYLAVRRSLGFDMTFEERVLRVFTAFADREAVDHITVDLFLRWKAAFGTANNNTWAHRLGMVRGFARWLKGYDERTEVPPPGLIPAKWQRPRPYIYSDKQVAAVVARAAKLRSHYGLRGWTFSTLFGLIAVTGLRINEALKLDDDDVDLDAGVITVKRGKNGKARFVPIAPSTVNRLAAYRAECIRLLGVRTGAFFCNDERPAADRLLRTLQLCDRLPGHRTARGTTLLQARAWTAHPRSASHVRRPHHHGLVPQGARPGSRDAQAQHLSRPCEAGSHLLVHRGSTGVAAARLEARGALSRQECSEERRCTMKTHPLPTYLQRFFTERLGTQLKASPNTVSSYRDTFRLLLKYAADQLRRPPTGLQVVDIDADLIGLFLADIESTRGNSARSRNTRLSAIRSFFKYVAVNEPQLLHHCQRVLAMPAKRHEKRAIDYLTRAEIEALIQAPDLSTWHGRRDRALLALALQTGLRVSELISLSCGDIVLGTSAHVRCMGKGRKERATPIRKDSAKVLRDWLAERRGAATDPVFVSNRDHRLSRDAVEQIVAHARDRGGREMPVTQEEARHAARASPQRGNAAPAERRRSYRHRALAWP